MSVEERNVWVDHKDHNGLNNQRANLRKCTPGQSASNKVGKGTSKYLGVHKKTVKRRGIQNVYWVAAIWKEKSMHLGSFPFTKEGEISAARAYNEKAIELHGDFANLNILTD